MNPDSVFLTNKAFDSFPRIGETFDSFSDAKWFHGYVQVIYK